MDALNENYKEALKQFIKCQGVLIESIKVDINRNVEDINLEEKKLKLNKERLNIECKSWNLATNSLRELE